MLFECIILRENPSPLGGHFSLICCSLFAIRRTQDKRRAHGVWLLTEQLNFSRPLLGSKTHWSLADGSLAF